MSHLVKISPNFKKITKDNYTHVLERVTYLSGKVDSGRFTMAERQERDRLSVLLDKYWSQDEKGNCIACMYSGSDEMMYQYFGCPNCYCEEEKKLPKPSHPTYTADTELQQAFHNAKRHLDKLLGKKGDK